MGSGNTQPAALRDSMASGVSLEMSRAFVVGFSEMRVGAGLTADCSISGGVPLGNTQPDLLSSSSVWALPALLPVR